MFTHQESFHNGKCLSEDFRVFRKAFWKDCTKVVYVILFVITMPGTDTSRRTSERMCLHIINEILGLGVILQ